MKILSDIPPNDTFLAEQYESTLYSLPNSVLEYVKSLLNPGQTVVLFSGSSRLNFDALYMESNFFSKSSVKWHPETIFVDPKSNTAIEYAIKKLNVENLLILNSTLFIKYRSWKKIFDDIQNYKKISKKVIVTLPINRFDFNRLKYSVNDIAKMLNGIVLDDTIICQ